MPNPLIQHIKTALEELSSKVLLIENNDGFLFRQDVQEALILEGFDICAGRQLEQRIAFELREPDRALILLSKERVLCLEDIESQGFRYEFFLENFVQGYHTPSIVDVPLEVLEKLFQEKQFIRLSKADTLRKVNKLSASASGTDFSLSIQRINTELNASSIDWTTIALLLGKLINAAIGTDRYSEIENLIRVVNTRFQEFRDSHYHQSKNSNATKHPQNVCKILDHLEFNFKHEKIALIVIDGMGVWQYKLLAEFLPGIKKEGTTMSWLPSITQLSRQAIFRGDHPEYDYRQGPKNEAQLWTDFWKNKGIPKHEIVYYHDKVKTDSFQQKTKVAIVYKDLDDNMHSSKDYVDLKSLTENWISRSGITETIQELLENNFRIFVTSDHGNIEARGWRRLKAREKLGSKNKSGSRSERHLEYSTEWLHKEFLENNEDIHDAIVQEEQAVYFKNNQSFSAKEQLVTHGGAHFLEMVIPFIEISNE